MLLSIDEFMREICCPTAYRDKTRFNLTSKRTVAIGKDKNDQLKVFLPALLHDNNQKLI
jgi:hypothetical protein